MIKKYIFLAGCFGLPFFALAQTHPCLNLLTQSAQAGVTAQICGKEVAMENLAAIHQQNQCAVFFNDSAIKSQLNQLASQSSQKAAQSAQSMGREAFCSQNIELLGNLIK